MSEQAVYASVQRLGDRVSELISELERSTRPPIAGQWAIQQIAKKLGLKIVVVDPVVEPLALVQDLMGHVEAQVLRAFEEHEPDDAIRDTVVDAGIMLLSYAPAAKGWRLTGMRTLPDRNR
mgnify:CR=1 FL=1